MLYVRNGIAKEIFAPPSAVEPRLRRPLRILVEGSRGVPFKGVGEALAAARRWREARHVTLVTPRRLATRLDGADEVVGAVSPRARWPSCTRETDVVLKLSRVEGMFGPPLEGFHKGATCVVTPVTGHDEYVEHGDNGLVVDWDDPRGTARALDLLARDRALLHHLRSNALATARGWPSWEQQGAVMAAALRRIAASRRPPRARPRGGSCATCDATWPCAPPPAQLGQRGRRAHACANGSRRRAPTAGGARIAPACSGRCARLRHALTPPRRGSPERPRSAKQSATSRGQT